MGTLVLCPALFPVQHSAPPLTVFWTQLSFRLKVFTFWSGHSLPPGLTVKSASQIVEVFPVRTKADCKKLYFL